MLSTKQPMIAKETQNLPEDAIPFLLKFGDEIDLDKTAEDGLTKTTRVNVETTDDD